MQQTYVTDDNPRREKPEKIRKAILRYIKKEKVFEIPNRSFAIRTAIKQSSSNEIILVAGKGHEEFQDYGRKKIKISDFQIVKKIKINKNKSELKINKQHNKFLVNKIIKSKSNNGFLGVSINSKSIKKRKFICSNKRGKQRWT